MLLSNASLCFLMVGNLRRGQWYKEETITISKEKQEWHDEIALFLVFLT